MNERTKKCRELRQKINAGLVNLAKLIRETERKELMLSNTGKLVNDLVALANTQNKEIADLKSQIAALKPSPEDAAAEKAATDFLAAEAAAASSATGSNSAGT